MPKHIKYLLLFLSSLFSSTALSQSCANSPFWADTLRCELYPAAHQTPPPPPTAPVTVSDIKDFTRVDLPWRNDQGQILRCLDGTQPVMYVDGGIDPVTNKPSNNWLFTFQGGGSCQDGESCLAAYLDISEQDEMTTARDVAMKNMQGIHQSDLSNHFHSYNRVRIQKCGYDRHNGNSTQPYNLATVPTDLNNNGVKDEWINPPQHSRYNPNSFTIQEGAVIDFDLFHHGQSIVRHALDTLMSGLSYTTWVEENGDVQAVEAALPRLVDADKVLFAGHSGGAHGLVNSIDGIASHLASWNQVSPDFFTGSVRAMFDANFIPSLENEAAFNSNSKILPVGAKTNVDIYDHVLTCNPSNQCTSGTNNDFGYDAQSYFGSWGAGLPYFDGPYAQWNVFLDNSCLNAHPVNPWKCADRYHVLFNHITTPFFVRNDFADPNIQHNFGNNGHMLMWGQLAPGSCAGANPPPLCVPILSKSEYRDRVDEQGQRLIVDLQSRSEQALAGTISPSVYLWLQDCGVHEGAFDDGQFFNTRLSYKDTGNGINLHDHLVDFMQEAPLLTYKSYVEGRDNYVSDCAVISENP